MRYLIPAHVAQVVKSEVRTGERVCVNWEMTRLETPGFNRFRCEHEIVPIPNYEGIAWDDIWRFNPQASSQWDGCRHYSTDMGDGTRAWYGGTKTWESLTLDQKEEYRTQTQTQKHRHSGLIQSEAVARFMWDYHIVAVAGDGVSFEVRPNRDDDWSMHHYCLAGWGVPIGEMFDLERLADLCKKLNRWTFFVTSSPLNHPRGVSSPPNCMALF
ncbi:unnamed protein product [Zymoseptoria tritici ST99CH_1E4]|uniref:Cyclase n=1 Tax=Zymoseptoria tritici ST99CH_1E4 TaxID=1276532 RepID=A0A2H1GY20_ZYMTR|nr:unnamed protein product [Zymoseptoria tritici ST99CH_1E4]